jgi:probable HAF family extracellular repeat protein
MVLVLVIGVVSSQNVDSQTSKIRYTVTDLGTLGGDSGTIARGINDSGQIVGGSCLGESVIHAYLYANSSMKDIGTFGGTYGVGNDINVFGDVVGMANITDDLSSHAFLYSNGRIEDIGSNIEPYAINIHKQIACTAYYADYNHASIYENGILKDIGTLGGKSSGAFSINDFGDIVGISNIKGQNDGHAFLYSGHSMKDLNTLGGMYSAAYKINNNGDIVGNSTLKGDTVAHAFLYSNGAMADLGSLSKYSSIAYGINLTGQIVGQALIDPSQGITHGFLYSNGVMEDLNNLIFQNSDWTIEIAISINNKGQIVGYGSHGQYPQRAFLLSPFSIDVIEKQPELPKYGELPVKESGKDSLIVITHGWNPDTTWLDTMTNNIRTYLMKYGRANWQVASYKWIDNATTGILPSAAQKALENGKQEGIWLGNSIGTGSWKHIHLIAHSAGSGLIQLASERIKSISPNTVVHCTFLDAFVGFDYSGVDRYGKGTDWSDSYFSRDSKTHVGGLFTAGNYTESMLTHAYNVDVTSLDPNKIIGTKFRSSTTGLMESCIKTVTSHGWPVTFYQNTIMSTVTPDYEGFGFPLSKEGENWNYAISHYISGNVTAKMLGTPDPTCITDIRITPPSYLNTVPDFTQLPVVESVTGTIQKYVDHLNLLSGSSVWLATVITPTNPVNIMSFDVQFKSNAGSQGLLTVLWDENKIGTVDERVVGSITQHLSLRFPNAVANSAHVLVFQLDPFTNIQTKVTLTKVAFNQVGTSQPFFLTVMTGATKNELPVYTLIGQAGFEYTVQSSTNLVDWQDIAILANTNGVVYFFDQNAVKHPTRFYRGIASY